MLLIFGKHGQVAIELQQLALARNVPFVAWSSSDADFTNPEQVCKLLEECPAPATVINAAAYTQVDLAETQPELAKQINATTPGAIAEVCRQRGHRLIQISTDYVFSGHEDREYLETDLTGPVGVYGETKLLGEHLVQERLPSSVILRTSWVFSAHGKNFVKTMLRLGAQRDQLSVVSDQHGGPTSARSIAACCLDIAAALQSSPPSDDLGGIYHFCGSPFTTWHGFAEEIFQQAGMTVRVRPISTSEYPTPAARPANSRLNCQKITETFGIAQPDWKQDLSVVLHELERLRK